MSWFDTTGIANLAKSALKEAQKTIDKALDIQDDDVIENNPVTEESQKKMNETLVISQSPSRLQSPSGGISTSIWGSFTGSFFDPKENRKVEADLTDEANEITDRFSKSQLVVSHEQNKESIPESQLENEYKHVKRRENSATLGSHNRLSTISCESNQNSTESLELLSLPTTPGSNLTSPSSAPIGTTSESVEVIAFGSESHRLSMCTDSANTSPFISPTDTSVELITPSSEETTTDSKGKYFKTSPDSVEVIPDDLCEEDLSIADDSVSYNSVSENTAVTVLEPLRPFLMQMGDSGHSEISNASDRTIDIPITRAPAKTGLHLSLQQDLNSNRLELKETESIPSVIGASYESEGSGSEKTIITDESSNVKSMLEDAMTEKLCNPTTLSESMQSFEDVRSIISSNNREFSPISSEKSSDIVKVGSEQTSGHTSADELETTTSSDIEIISSPNGDSSSTHSRLSPAVGKIIHQLPKHELGTKDISKIRGHCREPSETSSHSMSEDSEHDKLAKTIIELTDLLEARENKLLEIGRKNAELMEVNIDLKNQLESNKFKQDAMDMCNVTEEYTQRLSALEKKFQQAIREKDGLRKQLETVKQETAMRMSRSEIESTISEKEQTIKELREEGEKLSKQQLQYGNIIKKLRAKEKENEVYMKKQKDELESLAQESDRLKKSLNAKNEMERDQVAAIDRLTSENAKLLRDVNQYRGEVEDHLQKQETMKKSLDAARQELSERCRATGELSKRDRALTQLETEKRRCEEHNTLLLSQLEDLRAQITQSEISHREKAEEARLEKEALIRRTENAELRAEQLAESGLETTKPLLRQLEAMQETCAKRSKAWEKQESILVDKLEESQKLVKAMKETEKANKEEITQLKNKIGDLNVRLNTSMENENKLTLELETIKTELDEIEKDKYRNETEESNQIKILQDKITELSKQLSHAQNQLSVERANHESEKRKTIHLQEMLSKERAQPLMASFCSSTPMPDFNQLKQSRESSPTLSLGRMSGSESAHSALWHLEDSADCNSSVADGGTGSVYEIYRGGHSTQILESLQSLVKQRDGEIQQLNHEITRLTSERDCLSSEMAKLAMELDRNNESLQEHANIAMHMQQLQQQYDALLQMYGEKMEENQELLLDLQDVKDMYKLQIDELMAKQDKSK